MRPFRIVVLCAVCASASLLAQKPVISLGGIVNAASLAPASGPGHAIAPGSIASLFGQNLAATTASASGFPLPTTLAGTSLTVNGVAAPLFFVSPDQINFQVPSATDSGTFTAYGRAVVIVTTAAGSSDPVIADSFMSALGLFTLNATGCGPGAILNVKPDGTVSVNSPANSASPGDYIEIFGTGFGAVRNAQPDGVPATSDPLERFGYGVAAFFDGELSNGVFGGRAPGLVGVDQMNVIVPLDVRQGCAVPLQAQTRSTLSQPVTVSIHAGGGQCVDPPLGSAGQILLKKSVVLNDSTVPESDTLTASFPASPGKTSLPPAVLGIFDGIQDAIPAPACPIPGYSTLNAGVITMTGPGLSPTQIPPAVSNGNASYRASLPTGSIQPGAYQISSTGGASLGPFQTVLNAGAGIQITSQFPKGPLRGIFPYTVNWTGGQPGAVVTLQVIAHLFNYDQISDMQVSATAGTVTLAQSQSFVEFGPDIRSEER